MSVDVSDRVCGVCKHWLQLSENTGKCLYAEKVKDSFLYINRLCSCEKGFEKMTDKKKIFEIVLDDDTIIEQYYDADWSIERVIAHMNIMDGTYIINDGVAYPISKIKLIREKDRIDADILRRWCDNLSETLRDPFLYYEEIFK